MSLDTQLFDQKLAEAGIPLQARLDSLTPEQTDYVARAWVGCRTESPNYARLRESRALPGQQGDPYDFLRDAGVPLVAAPGSVLSVELLPTPPTPPEPTAADMIAELEAQRVPMVEAHRLQQVSPELLRIREAEAETGVPLVRSADMDATAQTADVLAEGSGVVVGADGLVDLVALGIPVRTLRESEYSTAERAEMARHGEARPDGSLPLRTREDVENAVKAWPLTSDPDDWAHIIKRAKSLGCVDALPADWHDGTGGLAQ